MIRASLTSLITAHREANVALKLIDVDINPEAWETAHRAEKHAAVQLAARATDPDVPARELRHYDQYLAVYDQRDQHRTSLTWLDPMPDDAVRCLRQYYWP